MLRLGITGGIASGKSTVSAMLREMGFTVLDADSIAHTLIEPGYPAHHKIVRVFGSSILNGDNHVNREALAKIVFGDRIKLKQPELRRLFRYSRELVEYPKRIWEFTTDGDDDGSRPNEADRSRSVPGHSP